MNEIIETEMPERKERSEPEWMRILQRIIETNQKLFKDESLQYVQR